MSESWHALLAAHDASSYLKPLTTTIRAAIAALSESSSPVGQTIRGGDVAIKGAIYDLAQDRIRPITHLANQSEAKRRQGVALT